MRLLPAGRSGRGAPAGALACRSGAGRTGSRGPPPGRPASSFIRKSPQPETSQCMRAPPISSRVTFSPITISAMRGEPEVHRGVALDHEHHVAERRDVGPAGRRGAEQQADLRDRARQPHLVAEDAPGVAAPGEHVDLIGDARAGRVDQIEQRDAQPPGGLLDADDLLDRARAPRARLHRGVVGHDGHRAPVHPPDAGDHAVGGQIAGAVALA